jgi:Na+/proline symporter
MSVYITLFGHFRIDIFFGSNKLENPVFWASVLGAFIGIGVGFLIGLFLSIFEFRNTTHAVIVSSLIPFVSLFLFYEIWGDGSVAVPAEDSYEIIKLSLISLIPSIIIGIIVSKVVSYFSPPH